MGEERITWTGDNTEEVVKFCCRHDPDLCAIHRVFNNLITGETTMDIEPADTMRGHCFSIPLGSEIIAVEEGYHHYIKINKGIEEGITAKEGKKLGKCFEAGFRKGLRNDRNKGGSKYF